MDLLRPMRRVSAALLLLVAFAVQVQAAPMPRAHAAPDSTLQGDASSVMLGIDSDSHHEIRFKSVLQQIVQYQLLQIILTAGNTHTTSGGPYPVVGVYFYMVLSYHLQFLRCVNEALTCTAEPDP